MMVILDRSHGEEFGIGRPYLDRDPPHVAPIDCKEYPDHCGGPMRNVPHWKRIGLTGEIVEGEKHLAHLKKAFQGWPRAAKAQVHTSGSCERQNVCS